MNKVLLVTGGSRGIGAATALLAAQQGWSVAVNYTANSLAADEVVRQIRASGGHAISIQADVADEAQVLRMFEHIDAKMGRLQGLVNNRQQRGSGRHDRPRGRDERGAVEAHVRYQCDWQFDLRP